MCANYSVDRLFFKRAMSTSQNFIALPVIENIKLSFVFITLCNLKYDKLETAFPQRGILFMTFIPY